MAMGNFYRLDNYIGMAEVDEGIACGLRIAAIDVSVLSGKAND
jgi:hypothetical protein